MTTDGPIINANLQKQIEGRGGGGGGGERERAVIQSEVRRYYNQEIMAIPKKSHSHETQPSWAPEEDFVTRRDQNKNETTLTQKLNENTVFFAEW